METPKKRSHSNVSEESSPEFISQQKKVNVEVNMAAIQESIKSIQSQLTDLLTMKSTVNETHNTVTGISAKLSSLEKKYQEMDQLYQGQKRENDLLKLKLKVLDEKRIQAEAYSRRDNLIFYGVPEAADETSQGLKASIVDIMKIKMKVSDAEKIPFVRIHRFGRAVENKPRPVLARFHYYPDKERVWKNRTQLKEHRALWLAEDFPEEIRNRRQVLMPIFKCALKTEGVKVSMSSDKLYLNNTMFTINNLHMLPDKFKLQNTSLVTSDDKVFFYTRSAPLSNHFPASFQIGGIWFNCSEQYYLTSEAETVGDKQIAEKIMLESNPAAMKRLSNTLQNPERKNDMSKWTDGLKRQVMMDALIAKFSQNTHLREVLLSTKDKLLVEASPRDQFWGAGVGLKDIADTPQENWPGANELGKALMEIRKTL